MASDAMNTRTAIASVIWWALYMSVFYLAYRVERQKSRNNIQPELSERITSDMKR